MRGNLKLLELKAGDEVGVARYGHRWNVHVETVIKITATQIVTQLQRPAIEGVQIAHQSKPMRFNKGDGKERTSGYMQSELWSMNDVRAYQQAEEARQQAEEARHATAAQIGELQNINWAAATDEQRAQVLALVESFKKES